MTGQCCWGESWTASRKPWTTLEKDWGQIKVVQRAIVKRRLNEITKLHHEVAVDWKKRRGYQIGISEIQSKSLTVYCL